jgi:hypothetical protein
MAGHAAGEAWAAIKFEAAEGAAFRGVGSP